MHYMTNYLQIGRNKIMFSLVFMSITIEKFFTSDKCKKYVLIITLDANKSCTKFFLIVTGTCLIALHLFNKQFNCII